jgi:hypothetical protein
MFTEDFSAFMNTAEFATSVTLNGVTVSAIYDAAYALGDIGAYGAASTQPSLTLATADVPESPVGKTATIDLVDYLVVTHEPDGTGVSRLLLRKV